MTDRILSHSGFSHIVMCQLSASTLPIGFSTPVSQFFSAECARKPQTRDVLRVLRSLSFQESNQNSQFRRKVSRAFLGNGGFAESKSGDWFDIALNARIPAFIGRMKAARVLHN